MEAGNGAGELSYRVCEMANKEQLAILKQGVVAWNKWREEHPDAEIDLRGAKLDELDLSGANFRKADIRSASFKKAMLNGADFGGSRFYCRDSYVLYHDYLNIEPTRELFDNSNENLSISLYENTILADDDVRNLLVRGNRQGISLKGKNLKGAYLVGFDLCDTDLRETNLVQANLSSANITGAKLYGSARENWIIDCGPARVDHARNQDNRFIPDQSCQYPKMLQNAAGGLRRRSAAHA